jgi:hypothetical protein
MIGSKVALLVHSRPKNPALSTRQTSTCGRRGSGNDLSRGVVECAIVVVVKNTTVEQLLSTSGHKNLDAKCVLPRVEESELAGPLGCAIGGDVMDLGSKVDHTGRTCWVSGAMSVEHVHQTDFCLWGQWILIDTKVDWVGKVRAVEVKLGYSRFLEKALPTSAGPRAGRCSTY